MKKPSAMLRPGRDGLPGELGVDWIYVGEMEIGVSGRETETKSIVMIVAAVRGRGRGRMRMARAEDVSAESLIPFVQYSVREGSIVRTDGRIRPMTEVHIWKWRSSPY